MERIDQIKQMLKDDPRDSFLQFALAMEYKNKGQQPDAIKIFKELRKNDKEYVGLYFHLGKCFEEMDDFQSALEIYAEGIAIADSLQDLHAKSELMNEKMNLELEM